MKARLLLLLVLGVALAAMPAVAFGDSARHLKNSTTYPDSTGEDPAAPDITSVVVSNDDAGLITLQVNVSNRPTLTADMYFLIFLDTDKNQSTGASDFLGADYAIQLVPGAVDLFQWNGTTYVRAASQASLTFSYTATGPVIRVSAADLGKTKAFNFGVIAASGSTVDAAGEHRQLPGAPRLRAGLRARLQRLPGADEARPDRDRLHRRAQAGEGRAHVLGLDGGEPERHGRPRSGRDGQLRGVGRRETPGPGHSRGA